VGAGGAVEGVTLPLLLEEGSGERAVPPSQKMFQFSEWKWCVLVYSGALFLKLTRAQQ